MASGIALSAHRVRVPLRGAFTTAVRSATELETVLVEARDGDGRRGWGEAPISVVTKTTTDAVLASVRGPLQTLVSRTRSPMDAVQLLAASGEPSAARNAVDCALHDLAAQIDGVPLASYLAAQCDGVPPVSYPGGHPTSPPHPVQTDMTLSVAAPDVLARHAAHHADAGFSCLKVKLSSGMDSLAAMRAVRAAVGPEITLRVDANQAFGAAEAIALIRQFQDADLGIELVEQPVRAGDWDGLAAVTRAVRIPVMADESVWTMDHLETLLRLGAAPMVNVKLAKAGGLYPARQLLARATAEGLGVIMGCMLESHVGIGAAAALATTLATKIPGKSTAQDLDGGLWLSRAPVSGGARYNGKFIELPDAPGQGIRELVAD